MQILRQWPLYFIGRLVPAAIGFGGIALYTRLLDPASFGTYALLLSVSFTVGLTGYSWLRVATLRLMAAVAPAERANLVATIGYAFAGASIAICATIVLVVRIFDPRLGWEYSALTAACALLSGWFELNVTIAQARLQVVTIGALQVVRALVALGSSIGLIAVGCKAGALLGGFAIGNCAGFLTARSWGEAVRGSFDRRLLRQIVSIGWPSSASGLGYISSTMQRFALDSIGGSAAVGVYAAATDLSQQTVGLIIGTATLAGQPLAFRARDLGTSEQLSAQLQNNARLVFAVGLPAAAGLVTLCIPISTLYLGPRFHVDAGSVMAISAIVMLVSGLRSSYFEQAFEIARQTRAIAVNTIVRVVLTIAFSIVLIGRFGLVGAALAMLCSEIVGFALSVFWARRLMHVPIPTRSWLKSAVAAAAMSVAVMLVPGRSTVLGLLASIVVGAIVYGATVALAHLGTIRAYLHSFSTLSERQDERPERDVRAAGPGFRAAERLAFEATSSSDTALR